MATNDPTNPWSASGWSLTAQGRYLQQYGKVRAEARARDAGTSINGPRPVILGQINTGGRRYAEVQTVRPGNPPIWRVMVPIKRAEDEVRIVDTGETRTVDANDARGFKDHLQ